MLLDSTNLPLADANQTHARHQESKSGGETPCAEDQEILMKFHSFEPTHINQGFMHYKPLILVVITQYHCSSCSNSFGWFWCLLILFHRTNSYFLLWKIQTHVNTWRAVKACWHIIRNFKEFLLNTRRHILRFCLPRWQTKIANILVSKNYKVTAQMNSKQYFNNKGHVIKILFLAGCHHSYVYKSTSLV